MKEKHTIPKIIHLIWQGSPLRNKMHIDRIVRWKEKNPDYEVKLHVDLEFKTSIQKQLNQASGLVIHVSHLIYGYLSENTKKIIKLLSTAENKDQIPNYGAVVDLSRFDVLKEGGFYFDIDIEPTELDIVPIDEKLNCFLNADENHNFASFMPNIVAVSENHPLIEAAIEASDQLCSRLLRNLDIVALIKSKNSHTRMKITFDTTGYLIDMAAANLQPNPQEMPAILPPFSLKSYGEAILLNPVLYQRLTQGSSYFTNHNEKTWVYSSVEQKKTGEDTILNLAPLPGIKYQTPEAANEFYQAVAPKIFQKILIPAFKKMELKFISNLLFRWRAAKRHESTGELIFTLDIFDKTPLLKNLKGSIKLYGQPSLCFSADKKTNNIMESVGTFEKSEEKALLDYIQRETTTCQILPPSVLEECLIAMGNGVVHGAINGLSSVLEKKLISRGHLSANASLMMSKFLHYFSLFAFKFIVHYNYPPIPGDDDKTHFENSLYVAALQTGTILLHQATLSCVKHVDDKLGLNLIGNKVARFGLFAIPVATEVVNFLVVAQGAVAENGVQGALTKGFSKMINGELEVPKSVKKSLFSCFASILTKWSIEELDSGRNEQEENPFNLVVL